MGERSSLLVLSVIAAALGVLLILDGPRVDGGPASTRVLPDFDADAVNRLVWQRPGQPDIVVTRTDGVDRLVAPTDAPVSRDAMTSVLGTLELMTYRRRDDAAAPGEPRFTLVAGDHVLRFGDSIPQLGRTWVDVGGRVLLVDDYVVRALDRTAADLRERDVFGARPHDITGIDLEGRGATVILDAAPMRLRTGGGWARVDPDRAARIVELVDSLAITEFVDTPAPGADPTLVVRVRGGDADQELRAVGRCADGVSWLVDTSVGVGCVPDAPIAELAAALTADLVDRRLAVAARPDSIRVGDMSLERRGAAWFFTSGQRADARAVAAWLEQVAALRAVDVRLDDRALPLAVAIGDEIATADARGRTVRRADEPLVLVFPDHDLLRPDPRRFYDRSVVSEEPMGLRSALRGDERITRGATHDDWQGGTDVDAIDAFRRAFGRLRAERFTDSPPRSPVTIEAVFDPPPGDTEPRRYTLDIDRQCRARTDGAPAPFIVAADSCAALLRRW